MSAVRKLELDASLAQARTAAELGWTDEILARSVRIYADYVQKAPKLVLFGHLFGLARQALRRQP